jgi:hypothetical protein
MTAASARSRILVGLTATAGALGAASLISAAAAPTARADSFSDIISVIDGDYTQGSDAFSSALSDFGSSDFTQGFAQLVDGFDDYSLSPVYNLTVGTAEALEGDSIGGSLAWGLFVPTDYAHGLTFAQSLFDQGQSYLSDAASALASADYVSATSDEVLGADYLSILPLEEIFLGAVASF